MRFVLDHDVDVEVGAVLRREGHDCWEASEAMKDPADDAVSVYADDKQAVVVAHDREFAARRKKNTFGQHVQMKCRHSEAAEVMAARLDELIEALKAGEGVFEMTRDSVTFRPPRWE